MSPEVCPTGCGRRRGAWMVMCAACWRRVPKPLQSAVYSAWHLRQDDPTDLGKTQAHEAAKAAAIRAAS